MNSTAISEAPDSTRKESEDVNEAEREEGKEEVEQRPFSPTDPSEFFVMDDNERHEVCDFVLVKKYLKVWYFFG